MTLEHIPEVITLPEPLRGEEWQNHAVRLNRELRFVIATVHAKAINDLTLLASGEILYLSLPDAVTGVYPDGAWRINGSSTTLLIQLKESGVWTTKASIDEDGKITLTSIDGVNITLTGDLTAVDAILSGDLTAVNATLTGDLAGVNATFSGDVTANNATFTEFGLDADEMHRYMFMMV